MDLYLAKMTDELETFYKVGVSSNAYKRFSFGTQMVADSELDFADKFRMLFEGQRYVPDVFPYTIEICKVVEFQFEGEARRVERQVLADFSHQKHEPRKRFSGYSECIQLGKDDIDRITIYYETMMNMAAAQKIDETDYNLQKSIIITLRNFNKQTVKIDQIDLHEQALRRLGVEPIELS